MKQIQALILLGISLLPVGCGSGPPNAINGNWTAALTASGTVVPTILGFTVTMNATGGNNLNVTTLSFTTSTPCFASFATGSFTVSANSNGFTSGGFQMTIQPASSSDVLNLQGTVSNNMITGNWTLSGATPGCDGSGNFTMNKDSGG